MWGRIQEKLQQRESENSKRSLSVVPDGIDFSSNDYLGLAAQDFSIPLSRKGSGGSRLISGNHADLIAFEAEMAAYYKSETALLFPSGYLANHSLFSMLCEMNVNVLYDAEIHASIRASLSEGKGKKWKFRHNDIDDLHTKLTALKGEEIVVVTEGLFSMTGDQGAIKSIAGLKELHAFTLIVDEAHSTGIYGDTLGASNSQGVIDEVDIRIHTFGKAYGAEGAIVVGNKMLNEAFANFSRPFIYSTAPSPHFVASVKASHEAMKSADDQRAMLQEQIDYFLSLFEEDPAASNNNGPIQFLSAPGNENAKSCANHLIASGINIKPILAPTVAKGEERIRICLHSFNCKEEIVELKTAFDYIRHQL